MDYFSELLESYSKLKKRTFKIVYINEQTFDNDPKFAKLKEVLMQAPSDQGYVNIPYPGLESYTYRKNSGKTSSGSISVQIGGKTFTILDPQGNIATLSAKQEPLDKNAQEKAIQTLLSSMDQEKGEEGSEEKGPTEEELVALEQERLLKLQRNGGALELAGKDPQMFKEFLKFQEKANEYIKSVCDKVKSLKNISDSLNQLCARPGAYTGGSSNSGWEYKLANSNSLVIDQEGNIIEKPLPIGVINNVAENHTALLAFLTDDQGDCATINTKVGFYRDKIVIWGAEKNEGVAFTPNALQKSAIDEVKNKCQGVDLDKLVSEKINSTEVNAVKGTMFELIMQSAVKIVARVPNAYEDLKKEIKTRKGLLTQYAKTLPPQEMQGAYSIDDTIEQDIILQQLEILNDPNSLKNFLLAEFKSALQVVVTLGAKDAIASGKNPKTGAREDIKLIFDNQQQASVAANKLGSTVVLGEDGTFQVGFGQKRYRHLEDIKAGEINSSDRLTLLSVTDDLVDPRLDEGFLPFISKLQYGNRNTQEQEAANTYITNLEEQIKKGSSTLSDPQIYFKNGVTKIQTPEKSLSIIASQIRGLLNFEQLRGTSLGRAVMKDDKNFRDFSDPMVQKRAKEIIEREYRFKKIGDDIRAGNKDAQNALLRMALVCGANARNMGQVITDDSGESHLIAHNEIFEAACKANAEGTLQISVEGTTATFTTPEGYTFKFSQEGTWGSAERHTRSKVMIGVESIKKLNRINQLKPKKSEPVNADTLHKFLYGQMKLLEELLKITR